MKKETENKRLFSMCDGRIMHCVPIEGETHSWELREFVPPVELTSMEEAKCKALGYDSKKVLEVKELLMKKMSPSAIQKKTGISRTSIYKYRDILSLMNTNGQQMNTRNTFITNSVHSNCLIFMLLGGQWTFSIFLVLVPILLLWIGAYLKREWERVKRENLAHREESIRLHHQFTTVCNLSFRREPIMCNSKKEADYYRRLLTHYNNQGRTIHIIERGSAQSRSGHFFEKEQWKKIYCDTNRFEIDEGNARLRIEWKNLIEQGLLDYLYQPKRERWKESKEYLYTAIDFLIENPAPAASDRSRQKQIIDLIPKKNNTYGTV